MKWPGLPDHYWNHDGDGHDQLLRAINRGPMACEILECRPPIYVWTWDQHELKKFFQTMLAEAFEFAALPSDLTTDEVIQRDLANRSELCRLQYDRSDSNEISLMCSFILQRRQLSDVFVLCPFLMDFNHDIVPGRSDQGECDLIMTDAHQRIWCIVEVKYINTESHGKTARSRRTRNRKLVIEQAVENRKRLFDQQQLPNPITNTFSLPNPITNTFSDSSIPSMLLILAAAHTNELPLQWATQADQIAADVLIEQHFV